MDLFPADFPEDVPAVKLQTVSLAKLMASEENETAPGLLENSKAWRSRRRVGCARAVSPPAAGRAGRRRRPDPVRAAGYG